MSISIKVSELTALGTITNDDYVVINDSGSTTTYRASFDTVSTWLGNKTGSYAVPSASFALSASYSTTASYSEYSTSGSHAINADTASRAIYANWVVPNVAMDANTINLVGTASWAASASYLPETTYIITASNASTASYLLYAANNGSASFAISASIAAVALNIVGGGAVGGESNKDFITKWTADGTNQPITGSSKIWNSGSVVVIGGADEADNVFLHSFDSTNENTLICKGGHLYMSGSSAYVGRGESNHLTFHSWENSAKCHLFISSSVNDNGFTTSSLVFQNDETGLFGWDFKSYIQPTATDVFSHVRIKPEIVSATPPKDLTCNVDIFGKLYVDESMGIGNLNSVSNPLGARLHISGASADTNPLILAETETKNCIYLSKTGQMGIGLTNPSTRLDVTGSIASTAYFTKATATTYYEGKDGTFLAFDRTEPYGTLQKMKLTFRKGLLVDASVVYAPYPIPVPEVIPTTVTPPTEGGGGNK